MRRIYATHLGNESARRHALVNDFERPPLAVDPFRPVAKRIKTQALDELGERQINASARNYYLSSAMYLLKDLPPQ
jgi:alkyl sulfatase BDS1-like metallo-beta-lactamase superfamily hydrolase